MRATPDFPGAEVAPARVSELGERVLRSLGAAPAQASAQIRQLVEADLRGRASHGMQRLPTLVARIRNHVLAPAAEPKLVWHTDVALSVDGGSGFGPYAALVATGALAPRAREHGLALAAVRNASHIGMLAPYVESLAEDGLLGFAFTTSEALVHPAGGRTALVGTNPIGVGVPAPGAPFVLDMSTAAISAGEIIAHEQRDTPLPPGCAVDATGNPTTDPRSARAGASSPFGGAKGYGLGLAVELVVAVLTRTALGTEVTGTLDSTLPATKGDVFLVLDPAIFGVEGPSRYPESYLAALRSAPTAPGVDRVRVPGDRMREERQARTQAGIRYPEELWQELLILEQEAGDRDRS